MKLDTKAFKRALMPAGIGMVALLSGCDQLHILNPQGYVGVHERNLILTAFIAMLCVVIPVIILTLAFAWHYRESNTSATYAPKWADSNAIEAVIWVVPIVLIVILAVLAWITSYSLDPYKPLPAEATRIKNGPVTNAQPIDIDVVALNWKWLFIYPEQGIATINEMAVPAGTPVNFHITSDSVLNSFFIPSLGSQVYAMAGMQTRLHLVANTPGTYDGTTNNFSGPGYADMKFKAIATATPQDFNAWVAKVKASSTPLSMDEYAAVSKYDLDKYNSDVASVVPKKAPVQYFSSVDPKLFQNIIAKYNNGNFRDFRDDACDSTKG